MAPKKRIFELIQSVLPIYEAKKKARKQLPNVDNVDESVVDTTTEPPLAVVADTTIINDTPLRLSLAAYQCNNEVVDSEFNIMERVKSVVEYMKRPENVIEPDDMIPLFEGSKFSVGQLARGLFSIFNKHITPYTVQEEILNIIYNVWGVTSQLPIALTNEGKSNLIRQLRISDEKAEDDDDDDSISALNATSKIENYTRKASRWIKINQCENSCCVYAGKLQGEFSCPTCNARRYKPCVRSECGGNGVKDDCDHLHRDGVEKKSLFYRLLIPLLVDLINTDYFVSALHYQTDCKLSDSEDFYTDILDGEVAKEHLYGMDSNYKAWCNESNDRADSVPVSLLLMEFYDGGQLFTYKQCNFWCLFTAIVNLPPAYRGKVGISTFLSAIYGGTHKTAERFLFTDLYCTELRGLYEGFEYVGTNGRRYFIQARLIFHCMDTKAMEPILNMQSMTNSRYGCPYCRNAHGQHNSWKTIYTGNRNTLPLKHYLRAFGQSGKCCPPRFYSPEGNWFEEEEYLNDHTPITAEFLLKERRGRTKMDFCQPCDENPERYEELKTFYQDPNATYTWYHKEGSGFGFSDIVQGEKGLKEILFYRHLDWRPWFEMKRINKEVHLKSAYKARDLNKNRTTKEEIHIHGFKGVWLFQPLPYGDMPRNTSPPPSHAMKGMITRCLKYMLGIFKERKPSCKITAKKTKKDEEEDEAEDVEIEDASKVKKQIPKYRPSYHKGQAPYSGSKRQRLQCHAWLLCVLVPVGTPSRSDWKLDIDRTGDFKIDMWKNLVLAFWDFILSILKDIGKWHQLVLRMFADKLLKLMSFSVEKNSISQLQGEVNEMVGCWEGAFPSSENYFQMHQIEELVSSIPLFGAMQSWNELFGEKALGGVKNIKKKTNQGGGSYEQYIMKRQVNSELDTMGKFYSKAVNQKDPQAANYKTKVSFDATTKILTFKDMQFDIYDPEKLDSTFTTYDLNRSNKDKDPKIVFHSSFNSHELNNLIELLLSEVRKRYGGSVSECNKNSCLYRCFTDKKKDAPTVTNVEWLKDVVLNDDLNEKAVVLVAKALLSLKPSFHSKAWIYGLQFRSRGSKCREYYRDYVPQNSVIDTADFKDFKTKDFDARAVLLWNHKKNYSSWCMFQKSDSILSRRHSPNRYGLLNAFFEVRIGDNSIDGLFVSSVTSHKYDQIGFADIVYCLQSLDPTILFVALQDIYPTRFAVVPISSNGKANKIDSDVSKDDIEFVNVFSTNMDVSYFYLLKMDADKLSRFPKLRPWTIYLSSTKKSNETQEQRIDDPRNQNQMSDDPRDQITEDAMAPCNSIKTNNKFVVRPLNIKYNEPRSTTNWQPRVSTTGSSRSCSGNVFKLNSQQKRSSAGTMANHNSSSGNSVFPTNSQQQRSSADMMANNNSSTSSSSGSGNSVFLSHSQQQSSADIMANHNSSSLSSSNSYSDTTSFRSLNSHFQSDKAYVRSLSILPQQSSSSSSSSSGDFVSQGNHNWTLGSGTTTVDVTTDVTLHINTSEGDQIPNNASLPSLRNMHLTETRRTELTELLNRQETNEVLIDKFNIDMTVAKITCLRPRTWLNDEVINFYLSMLQSDLNQCTLGQGKIYSFNTFFMVRLLQNDTYNFANVARWTKRVDIFGFQKVFIPINFNNLHWTLIVIDFTMKTFTYYDALRGNGDTWITAARTWFRDEATAKNKPLNLNEWAFYSRVDRTVPQQENGFDCGMFIIMYVDSLVNNRSVDHLSFTQQQIPEYRLKLANAILRGSLNNNENNIVSDAIFI